MLKIMRLLKWLSTDMPYRSLEQELNQEAIVMQVIRPGKQWRVHYSGSYWNARSLQATPLQPGDIVYVIGRQNITLIVEPSLINHYQGVNQY
jgi:membrane protein implicated in regulation of membrane protease activity